MKPQDEWLFKADHDLKSAEYLLGSPSGLYDASIYSAMLRKSDQSISCLP